MLIRKYRPSDCGELSELFYDTVHSVNARDYTSEQLDAWAAGTVDLDAWNCSFLQHYTLVAADGELLVGFGDINQTGYLDRLYVHKNFQGKGIASALCNKLEQAVTGKIVVHASITARPFFENRGYVVKKEQQVERHGILLTNYVMEKQIVVEQPFGI